MRMGLRGIWVIVIVLAFFLGTITTGIVVFADKAPKTLAEECAKKLDHKGKKNLDGLFCLAIQSLNAQFGDLFVQTDLTKPVLYLRVDPESEAPALVVNDGTNDLFTVNNDGSIQIGSNTVVVNPDGTVTGGPLHLFVGSTVDNKLISTEPDEDILGTLGCNNKELAQVKGKSWKCTKPEDIGTPSIVNTEFVIRLGSDIVTDKFPNKKIIKEFQITGLPSSTEQYEIPINLMQLGANMRLVGAASSGFDIFLESSSDGVNFSRVLFIVINDPGPIYRSSDNLQEHKNTIIIEAGTTKKFFRLIGFTFDNTAIIPTGSFDNLKFVMELPLPDGATIEEIP